MTIPPISEGRRITKEEAIRELQVCGFTVEDANLYLDEPDVKKRWDIVERVTKRAKEGE